MKYSEAIKPVSYVKAHASEMIRKVSEEGGSPLIITQNGEARAVLMGVREYETLQESLALLKILAMGQKDIEEGRTAPMEEAFERIRRQGRNNAV